MKTSLLQVQPWFPEKGLRCWIKNVDAMGMLLGDLCLKHV